MLSPLTAKPQDHSLPAQDVDDRTAMPPLTGLPPCCRRILMQPPVSAWTTPLKMGKTQPMSQAHSFSGNVLSSDSETAKGAAATVCLVINLISGETYQQTMETCQHQGGRGMLARANIPRRMVHRLGPIPVENRLGPTPVENQLRCIPVWNRLRPQWEGRSGDQDDRDCSRSCSARGRPSGC